MKVKLVTYGQMLDQIEHLISSGERKRDDPFTLNGQQFSSIVDAATNEKVVDGDHETVILVVTDRK